MKVSMASSFGPIKAEGTALKGAPLLSEDGPYVVLGWQEQELVMPNTPSASVLFGPRGAARAKDGSLWVADTGHHRLLGWLTGPTVDNQDADILIGQPSYSREGRNAKGEPSKSTLNVPTGVSRWRDGIAVADAWNHRVLLWHEVPKIQNQPADIVLGQKDGCSIEANHGRDAPRATSLHWPYGVVEVDGKLAVCDAGNRRVLIWNSPEETGQPADLVLGQNNMETRDENCGQEIGRMGMRWPHAAVNWQGGFAVADAGNNRVMLWDEWPTQNGQPCSHVLGQKNFTDCDHNLASYYPTSAALNMPYAVAVSENKLLVADTANSRLVGWRETTTGADADWLTGQPDFASKGDNRWGIIERDSLCWPYGITSSDDELIIADSGNNRVLLWRMAK
ncbi:MULTISPECIES: hypothetical protein [unclassified Hyphomonas]|nr:MULTISPECIES: hypothetical protein [unclassified Hyphomonas]MAB09641.1 hypothetical protein [Hyphomonas sp.]MBM56977.1 hypothetical protein [Hyphomonas sp.]RIJ14141.1 hypothetical protein D1231_17545 [Henriciella mobilis]RIJ21468.1 hypothetical protein D1227_10785 [Henriciella mobilis]|tara:strand:- start:431 stop:1609 length:1179 start_codon:yes stop_codon:yes gene_type:complete